MTGNDDDNKRPSPEAMLKLCREEEAEEGRGKLKIFLGYAAGVGKTYAMLEAAWQRRLEERDGTPGGRSCLFIYRGAKIKAAPSAQSRSERPLPNPKMVPPPRDPSLPPHAALRRPHS